MNQNDFRPHIKQIDEQIAAMYEQRKRMVDQHCRERFFAVHEKYVSPIAVHPEDMEDYERLFYIEQVLYLLKPEDKGFWVRKHEVIIYRILHKLPLGDPKEMGLQWELSAAASALYRHPYSLEPEVEGELKKLWKKIK